MAPNEDWMRFSSICCNRKSTKLLHCKENSTLGLLRCKGKRVTMAGFPCFYDSERLFVLLFISDIYILPLLFYISPFLSFFLFFNLPLLLLLFYYYLFHYFLFSLLLYVLLLLYCYYYYYILICYVYLFYILKLEKKRGKGH